MGNKDPKDGRIDVERHQEKVSELTDDGSGCAEMWQTMNEQRSNRTKDNCCGGSTNRRGILGGILATAASAIGFPGIAGAKEDTISSSTKRDIKKEAKKYRSVEAVEENLHAYGSAAIDELKKHSIINDDHLNISEDQFTNLRDMNNEDDFVIVLGKPSENGATALIQITRDLSNAKLNLFVEPEKQKAHAVVWPKNNAKGHHITVDPHGPAGGYDEDPKKLVTDGGQGKISSSATTFSHGGCFDASCCELSTDGSYVTCTQYTWECCDGECYYLDSNGGCNGGECGDEQCACNCG